MRIAFRVDASIEIGAGHVMRCLTLADTLRARGAQCHFVSRQHSGSLLNTIRRREHGLTVLPPVGVPNQVRQIECSQRSRVPHAAWLGTDWQTDAAETSAALSAFR